MGKVGEGDELSRRILAIIMAIALGFLGLGVPGAVFALVVFYVLLLDGGIHSV